MSVYITNVYGLAANNTEQIAQNQLTSFVRQGLDFQELGIYSYNSTGETERERWARFDGILARLVDGDTVVFQSPTGNSIDWDIDFMNRLAIYPHVKKVVMVERVDPLMSLNARRALPKYIDFYNHADVLVLPTPKMLATLRNNGLKTEKVVFQQLWDHPANIDLSRPVPFKRMLNFAADPVRFRFMNSFNPDNLKLRIFSSNQITTNPQIEYVGWHEDHVMMQMLRDGGGFGLIWGNDSLLEDYMKQDCSFKLSTYLSAGLPVIMRDDMANADLVKRKHLGLVVTTLDEAVGQIKAMSEQEYQQYLDGVNAVAPLVRNGFFTKRALMNAIFTAYEI